MNNALKLTLNRIKRGEQNAEDVQKTSVSFRGKFRKNFLYNSG
ncbi:hypothetical protein SAMN05216294_1402 [Flagellimonas zhangzhouensis]|uniref:Uncharacterized protein n=1 Tax=Flagellimonas zhangzhouensis TaxID=1073328 RepID=A0A1H2Q3Z7_9FLAO|nr:hypothetical protein SAMN05216294_1402 [Allomuricauda zhangzhouensis]SDW01886.1 hypothetical protein SAMN04487892_0053 [Allomuricauda zhangzhouensis]